MHLLGQDFFGSLRHIVWRGDIIGHVEVDVFVTRGWVEARLPHIQGSRAKNATDKEIKHALLTRGFAEERRHTSRRRVDRALRLCVWAC